DEGEYDVGGVLHGQGHAHGPARTEAQAAAAALATVLARLAELPDPRCQAVRPPDGEHPVLVLHRVLQLGRQATDGQRALAPASLDLLAPAGAQLVPQRGHALRAAAEARAIALAPLDHRLAGVQELRH